MEAAGSTETSICIYKSARRHIPEDRNHIHLRRTLETCSDMDGGGRKTVHHPYLHKILSFFILDLTGVWLKDPYSHHSKNEAYFFQKVDFYNLSP